LSTAMPDLTMQPESVGRVPFQLSDDQGQPVPGYPVYFSLVGPNSDGGVVDARLSTASSLTDQNGSVVLEVIAGGVGSFGVQASSPGAPSIAVDVLVTPNRYQVAIVPAIADDLMDSPAIAHVLLYFFDDSGCNNVDLAALLADPTTARGPIELAPGNAWLFSGVSGQGTAAAAALGFDSSSQVRIGGCLDIPGALLLQNETMTATLLLDRLLPSPVGVYQVASDISLFPPPTELPPEIQAPWQEWTRCPLDPARLWLDCTIGELATGGGADPNNCAPVPGSDGALGALLDARRGVALATAGAATTPDGGSTPHSVTTTPCRASVDAAGSPSLDAIVNALFDSAQSRLANLNLAGLPAELATLLGAFHLDSTMKVTAGAQPNSYLVDHALVDVSFPGSSNGPTLTAGVLGLPIPNADGITANMSNGGQLQLSPHGFTLRLGTAAQYAFAATSLSTSRGVADISHLVAAVFALAELSDQGQTLTGCNALDSACCKQIGQPSGCLVSACTAGLSALAQKLLGTFANLDENDIDFYLSLGYAPAIATSGSISANALGTLRSASGVADPGVWVGTIAPSAGSYSVRGTWLASASAAKANTP
ncbi:MAG: hypothetical protein ABSB49_18415, partial [Polyangia bacterium]